MRGKVVIFAALAALVGCDRVPDGAIQACQSDVHVAPARTDVLVVVDDSLSMKEEQENLRQNLAAFVQELTSGAIPHDVQIGVTTTSVDNTHGQKDEYPYDASPYDGRVIPYPKGELVAVDPRAIADPTLRGLIQFDEATKQFLGTRLLLTGSTTMVSDFEANVLVGTQGSDKEEPLKAVQLALTDRIADGTNAGFLRPGARLAVIVVTDEDDCSEWTKPFVADDTYGFDCHDAVNVKPKLASLPSFAQFLKGSIAGEERDTVLAVIAGFAPDTLEPTGCATSFDKPTRFDELLGLLDPARTFKGSICDASFHSSLQHIADILVPQTVPLDGTPPEVRMLVASVHRGAESLPCTIAPAGDPSASAAGAVYSPPQGGRPASLTFQGACRLQAGDQVKVSVICAG